MDRTNNYERAFAAYLRHCGAATIAVDETRRAVMDEEPVKSADFIVVNRPQKISHDVRFGVEVDVARLVVDVKGRRFPGGTADRPREIWQNWSTELDVKCLRQWAESFGESFRGVFAFVYEIARPYEIVKNTLDRFDFENRSYLMRGIDALAYAATMKPRSKRWGTVHLPAPAFRALCRPFSFFLNPWAFQH